MYLAQILNTVWQRRKKNQLDATEWFIAIIICSTYFGHLYAHHQDFETVLVFLPRMVCNALVVGGRRSGVGQQAMPKGWGKLLQQRCDDPSLFFEAKGGPREKTFG